MARVWFHPHETSVTFGRAGTRLGRDRSCVCPTPSCPWAFQPAIHSSPLTEGEESRAEFSWVVKLVSYRYMTLLCGWHTRKEGDGDKIAAVAAQTRRRYNYGEKQWGGATSIHSLLTQTRDTYSVATAACHMSCVHRWECAHTNWHIGTSIYVKPFM